MNTSSGMHDIFLFFQSTPRLYSCVKLNVEIFLYLRLDAQQKQKDENGTDETGCAEEDLPIAAFDEKRENYQT